MKIFLLLMLVPLFANAQEKHDTKITVTANDTVALFKRVALYLLEQGYTIENKYDDLQTLTTIAHPFKGTFAATYKIGATVKGNDIILTGLTRLEIAIMGTQPSNYDPVDYRPAKGHLYHRVWDIMEAIAKNFGSELRYSK